MRKLITGVIFVFVAFLSFLLISANTIGAPSLAYVYSESMEPTIHVNDAFLVWPESEFEVGDIIMYRPVSLKATFVTHRIIQVTPEGYITLGDNSPSADQDAGEPFVTNERIVGKVLMLGEQPFIIPQLGLLTESITGDLAGSATKAAIGFLVLGILSIPIQRHKNKRRRKKPRRWRLSDIYRFMTLFMLFAVLFGIIVGSRTHQIRYLVSAKPGSFGDQIQLGEEDQLSLNVSGTGLLPSLMIVEAQDPLSLDETVYHLYGSSIIKVPLYVEPHQETGFYQGYVKVSKYPILMPDDLIIAAHSLSPLTGIVAEGMAFTFWALIFFMILDQIPGLYGYTPVSELIQKSQSRRWKRLKKKLLGNRRERST